MLGKGVGAGGRHPPAPVLYKILTLNYFAVYFFVSESGTNSSLPYSRTVHATVFVFQKLKNLCAMYNNLR